MGAARVGQAARACWSACWSAGREVNTAVRPPGDTQHCYLVRLPSASTPSFRPREEEEEGIAPAPPPSLSLHTSRRHT